MKAVSISVAVPVYNEEQNLEYVIRDLRRHLEGHDYELIIVNDGSKDGTGALADRLAAEDPARTRVIHHPTNLGGGAATRTGLMAGTKDWVTMIPGDGQFKADDMPQFFEALEGVDFVLSRRRNRTSSPVRALNSWIYRKVVRVPLGINFREINCVTIYRHDLL